ncbi:hypothetical protein [Paenibacillus medicaginis]|uniref:Uncharacterized protein n=1 Tax=Paenibacillus medicaginis TaxID=1470560 RepID=A0ABV5BVR9_9BACL
MTSLNHILGYPEIISGIGEVHPITLKDYDLFESCSSVLYLTKAHFGENYADHFLLDLLVLGVNDDVIKNSLRLIFSIVTKKEVTLHIDASTNNYAFVIDEENQINKYNYDQLRQLIMKQNLMFEQKVYKNKIIKEWAEKALKARSKKGAKITIEDIISTISVFTGKHYKDLASYTIYQLQSDFNRINKLKDYDATIAFKCAGDDKSKIGHYAEFIDLFKNPNDDPFVDDSKLANLNSAIS